MPIVCVCANGHRMQVDDVYAGQQARCPLCREYVLVPRPRGHERGGVPTEPAPERPRRDSDYPPPQAAKPRRSRVPDEPEEPMRRSRVHREERRKQTYEDDHDADREDEEFRKRKRKRRRGDAVLGQQLQYVGLFMLVVALCGEVGAQILYRGARAGDSGALILGAFWIEDLSIALRLAATLLICLSSINASARGFGIAAILLGVGHLIVAFLLIAGAIPVSPGGAIWFQLINSISWGAQMLFLRQVAIYFDDRDLADETTFLMVLCIGSDFFALFLEVFRIYIIVHRVWLMGLVLLLLILILIGLKLYFAARYIMYVMNLLYLSR